VYDELVAVDFETTGLDPIRDDIIDFGAVRFRDGQILEVFSQLANPGRPVPIAIERLTSIHTSQLADAPAPEQVIPKILDFIGDTPIIAHNAQFEGSFLESKTYGSFDRPILDTLELSRILLPTAQHHDLQSLASMYGITPKTAHRAAADAETTALLWSKLLEEIDLLPTPILEAITSLIEPTQWIHKILFVDAEKRRVKTALWRKTENISDLLHDFSDVLKNRNQKSSPDEVETKIPARLDPDEVALVFDPGGPLANAIPGYERRSEQTHMLKAVCEAFNDSQLLMVEAGTGTGKSLAYLVPSIQWATLNDEKVVLSTNTKNLQSQLSLKDIPLLRNACNADFNSATIKGRANYLCVRKLLYILKEAERELENTERLQLLSLLVWLPQTASGDISENTGFAVSRAPDLWRQMYSTGEECLGRACPRLRNCFLMQARAKCMTADIIVANHSVVFSELGIDSPVLPKYSCLVFDEAQNVENVATDLLAVQIERWSILRILNRLYKPDRRGGGRGLLPNLLYHLRRGRETTLSAIEKQARNVVTQAIDSVLRTHDSLDSFLSAAGLFHHQLPGKSDKRRFKAEDHQLESFYSVDVEKRNIVRALGNLKKRLEWLEAFLDDIDEKRDFEYRIDLLYEIRAWIQLIEEQITSIAFVLEANEDNFVYWIEKSGSSQQENYRLAAAPLDVGPLMKDLLYDRKKTIVFCSATMSVNGKFNFFETRLGLNNVPPERLVKLELGTSFDYPHQVMICVPTFLPEPSYDARVFDEAFAHFLTELHTASQGRGLVLFTSYNMLNQVYSRVKSELEHNNLLVLGQGIDGSREQITSRFQKDTSSILFGTQSFWEGVDIIGDALSCLTVAKLPFPVPTEPIVKARGEQLEARGEDSFTNYSLPSAIIRLKQGIGRLIRSRTDIGVIVIADKRILTKRYGRQFLKALPTTHRSFANADTLCAEVSRFLGDKTRRDSAPLCRNTSNAKSDLD